MFIIESIISGMMAIADVIWGWPILILTSFVAVYMTVRLRFFQFRHFGLIMKETFGKVFDKEALAKAISIPSRQPARPWRLPWA